VTPKKASYAMMVEMTANTPAAMKNIRINAGAGGVVLGA
jgi:hypothetical protein